ncbi:hypothetical protein, partial [Corynebacterium striatum]|uniref:hypothetical protein n=1 Tax=Corynebacterium striatum TaxID=43770 RepID=UPI001C0E8FF1
DDVTGEMPTGEDAHGSDYFTPVFLLPQLCNSTLPFSLRFPCSPLMNRVYRTIAGYSRSA